MVKVTKPDRWTILNIDQETKKSIVEYAKFNGFTIARAIKELVKDALEKWKKKTKQ